MNGQQPVPQNDMAFTHQHTEGKDSPVANRSEKNPENSLDSNNISGKNTASQQTMSSQEAPANIEPLFPPEFTKTEEVVTNSQQVRYVEDKTVKASDVWSLLTLSKSRNQWSNFGPVSQLLEQELTRFLKLDHDLRVVFCANATIAIHALVNMLEHKQGKPLNWVTSAFGFYSTIDGPLQSARIIDCNAEGMLDLKAINTESDDALVVTNMFGQENSLEQYRSFAQRHNKPLIIDAAVALGSHHHRENECISFHHTKPWGFGEAGCAIVHESDEALFREMISFGHMSGVSILRSATNGKISDIACAFVLQRLQTMHEMGEQYQLQYQRIESIGQQLGLKTLSNTPHPSIPSNVPLVFPYSVPQTRFREQMLPLGKYYHPLSEVCANANNIYSRIVNVPCHHQMALFSDSDIHHALQTLLDSVKVPVDWY